MEGCGGLWRAVDRVLELSAANEYEYVDPSAWPLRRKKIESCWEYGGLVAAIVLYEYSYKGLAKMEKSGVFNRPQARGCRLPCLTLANQL